MSEPIAPEPSRPVNPNGYAPSGAYATGPGAPATPVLSIISMISGILGFVVGFIGFGLLFSIAAIVLGHMGQRREPAARGFWLTGLIAGYAGVALNIIVLIFLIIAFTALAQTAPFYLPN